MKKILLSATALVALSASGFAADLPSRVSPVAAPLPVFTWTGLYVGGTVGMVSLGTKAHESYSSGTEVSNVSGSGSGATLGGTIGYNYQIGAAVVGLEADYGFASAKNTHNDNHWGNYGDSSISSMGTVRARLGYAFDRTLLFVTGGYAFAQLNNAFGNDYPNPSYSYSSKGTAHGWVLGAGVEHAITNNITVKAEALYADLGKRHGYDGDCGCQTTFKNTVTTVRIGANYKF
eukprot:gene18857-biopygen11486